MIKKINELDGCIFVTPEYNRGITSALKNENI
ncbi:NADPH-dependent FMN reductase [Paenibacillus periandrae]